MDATDSGLEDEDEEEEEEEETELPSETRFLLRLGMLSLAGTLESLQTSEKGWSWLMITIRTCSLAFRIFSSRWMS